MNAAAHWLTGRGTRRIWLTVLIVAVVAAVAAVVWIAGAGAGGTRHWWPVPDFAAARLRSDPRLRSTVEAMGGRMVAVLADAFTGYAAA
ncbi:hypothetical protein IRT45_16240 [Nocardia sp. BSTN01]|uniref:hypothetical protein n=1 Tax=Nocardia sp. BSTN01 TaxID=2783665 RepID=UPI00188F859D|nr:hypothetical protein [Nocardia sp. BSTN01]MBF4998696.1 hypothetical protein [Nocardia sp. BSTN01]